MWQLTQAPASGPCASAWGGIGNRPRHNSPPRGSRAGAEGGTSGTRACRRSCGNTRSRRDREADGGYSRDWSNPCHHRPRPACDGTPHRIRSPRRRSFFADFAWHAHWQYAPCRARGRLRIAPLPRRAESSIPDQAAGAPWNGTENSGRSRCLDGRCGIFRLPESGGPVSAPWIV